MLTHIFRVSMPCVYHTPKMSSFVRVNESIFIARTDVGGGEALISFNELHVPTLPLQHNRNHINVGNCQRGSKRAQFREDSIWTS
jgi:hypothetical protein